jgi:hypothetical protein
MVDHLLAPSLLGYAGEQVDGLPTPAGCTQLGLHHSEFSHDGAHDSDAVFMAENAGEDDRPGISVEDASLGT